MLTLQSQLLPVCFIGEPFKLSKTSNLYTIETLFHNLQKTIFLKNLKKQNKEFCYQTSALPPSHHGWVLILKTLQDNFFHSGLNYTLGWRKKKLLTFIGLAPDFRMNVCYSDRAFKMCYLISQILTVYDEKLNAYMSVEKSLVKLLESRHRSQRSSKSMATISCDESSS